MTESLQRNIYSTVKVAVADGETLVSQGVGNRMVVETGRLSTFSRSYAGTNEH